MKKLKFRQYKLVGKTGHETRWRDVPVEGWDPPTDRQAKKLGPHFAIYLRGPPKLKPAPRA